MFVLCDGVSRRGTSVGCNKQTNSWKRGVSFRVSRRKRVKICALCDTLTHTLKIHPGEDDGDLEGGSQKKPLKVNRDLLLWKAREYRNLCVRCNDSGKRRVYLTTAEKLARRVLDLDPQDGRGYVSLAHILKLQGRFQVAANIYQEGCAATQGGNAHIWTSWAHLEAQRGSFGKARSYFDAALTASPDHIGAWHSWAMLEKCQGDYLRARDLLLRGVQNCGQNDQLYQSMALLAMELGLVEEARRWFEDGQSLDNVDMCYSWAVLEAQQGKIELAVELFERALEVDPQSRNAYLTWGMWERQRGEYDKARKLFQIGCLHNSGDGLLLSAWAQLETQLGKIEDARALFQQAVHEAPSNISIWQHYATLEFSQGKIELARSLFRQGVDAEMDPENELLQRTFTVWGQLECEAGDYELARELFKCAVRMKPFNEDCLEKWLDMEESLGNLKYAAAIRRNRAQQRIEIELPSNFSTRPQSPICPIAATIMSWLSSVQQQKKNPLTMNLRDFDWAWLRLGLQSGRWEDIVKSVGQVSNQIQQPQQQQQLQPNLLT